MKQRVLVIDDEPAIRYSLETALEDAGVETRAVGTAEEALSWIARERFDLLLVDKDLPGMSGVSFIREVRARDQAVHIAVLTGNPTAQSAMATLNLGIDAYFDKPVSDIDEFVRLIQRLMATKRGPSAPSPLGRLWRSVTGAPRPGALRVVVASADVETAAGMAAAIAPLGVEVALAGSLAQLLELIAGPPPDLAIVDAALERDAGDLVADIGQRAPATACVVVAQDLPVSTVRRLTHLGAKGIVTEPPDSPAFARALVDIVHRLQEARRS